MDHNQVADAERRKIQIDALRAMAKRVGDRQFALCQELHAVRAMGRNSVKLAYQAQECRTIELMILKAIEDVEITSQARAWDGDAWVPIEEVEA